MAQVRKFRNGGGTDAANFELAMQNATPEQREYLAKKFQDAQQFMDTRGGNRRDARQMTDAMYRFAQEYLKNGEINENRIMAPSYGPFYTRSENEGDAYRVMTAKPSNATTTTNYGTAGTAGTGTGTVGAAGVATAPAAGTVTPAVAATNGDTYSWKWNRYYDSSLAMPTESLTQRANAFISALSKAVNEANGTNARLLGVKKDALTAAQNVLTPLSTSTMTWDAKGADSIKAFNQLRGVITGLGVDADAFKNAFSEFYADLPEAEKQRNAFVAQGYSPVTGSFNNADLDKKIAAGNYTAWIKDGKTYLMDSNYNPVTNFSYIDDADEIVDRKTGQTTANQTYNWLAATDSTGAMYWGNAKDLDSQSPYYNTYRNLQNELRTQRYGNFGNQTSMSWNYEFENPVLNLLNNVISKDHPGYNVTDVSALFGGDDPIFAVKPDGTPIAVDAYNNYKTSDLKTCTFYRYNPKDGKFYTGSFDTFVKNYDYNRLGQENEPYDTEIRAKDYMTALTNQANNFNANAANSGSVSVNAMLRNSPDKFLREMRYVFQPNADISKKFDIGKIYGGRNLKSFQQIIHGYGIDENPLGFAKFMYNVVTKNGQVYPSKENAVMLKNLIAWASQASNNTANAQDPAEAAVNQKQGGVLRFAQGGVTNLDGSMYDPLQAYAARDIDKQSRWEAHNIIQDVANKEANGNSARMRAKKEHIFENGNWTKADTLRAAALAADMASLVAAFSSLGTGGAGSVAAAGLGLASMGADLAADVFDESVSGGEAAWNAVLNTGMAVAGAFGGKGLTMGAKLAKFAPRVLLGLGAIGVAMDSDTYSAWKKVSNGDFTKITRDEAKLLAASLRVLAGGVRVGSDMRITSKQNSISKSPNGSTDPKVEITPTGKKITQNQYDRATELIKSKQSDLTKVTQEELDAIGITQEELGIISNNPLRESSGVKSWFGKKNTGKVRRSTETATDDDIDANLRELAEGNRWDREAARRYMLEASKKDGQWFWYRYGNRPTDEMVEAYINSRPPKPTDEMVEAYINSRPPKPTPTPVQPHVPSDKKLNQYARRVLPDTEDRYIEKDGRSFFSKLWVAATDTKNAVNTPEIRQDQRNSLRNIINTKLLDVKNKISRPNDFTPEEHKQNVESAAKLIATLNRLDLLDKAESVTDPNLKKLMVENIFRKTNWLTEVEDMNQKTFERSVLYKESSDKDFKSIYTMFLESAPEKGFTQDELINIRAALDASRINPTGGSSLTPDQKAANKQITKVLPIIDKYIKLGENTSKDRKELTTDLIKDLNTNKKPSARNARYLFDSFMTDRPASPAWTKLTSMGLSPELASALIGYKRGGKLNYYNYF